MFVECLKNKAMDLGISKKLVLILVGQGVCPFSFFHAQEGYIAIIEF